MIKPMLTLPIMFLASGCLGTSVEEGSEIVPISSFIAGNETAFEAEAAYVLRDTSGQTVSSGDPQDVSISFVATSGDQYEVHLETLGNTVVFTEDDLNEEGYEYSQLLDDGVTTAYLWVMGGTWAEVFAGETGFDYIVPFGTSDYDDDTGINDRLHGVIGLATPANDLPTTAGSVAYDGTLSGTIFTGNDPDQRYRANADVELNVTFATSEISGQVGNFVIDDDDPQEDVYFIDSTSIENGTFSSSLTPDLSSCEADGCATLTASDVSGAFYGPNGEEIGGTVEMEGVTSGDSDFVFTGAFGAGQE